MNAPLKVLSSFALDLSDRGYQVLFQRDEENHCPGCGSNHWLVGRLTAECASCGTALPLGEIEDAQFDPSAKRAVALHFVQSPDSEAPVERRREERRATDGLVLALFLDGSPHAFSVVNKSGGGMMGEAVEGIAEASSIVVELEDGTLVPAEMKWTDRGLVGVAFVEPPRRRVSDWLGVKRSQDDVTP